MIWVRRIFLLPVFFYKSFISPLFPPVCRFTKDDGFPGDEDNGSMAAWYIFSCLGIYPITPGKPIYTNCKPIVDNIRILGKKVDFSKFGNIISHEEIMKEIEE